jgi:branched-chain amino acid transport system ATP-binding protein
VAGAPGRAVTDVVLETRGLARHFGGVAAVDGVDLALRDGEIRALIGPNGAGKTTLMNLLSGLLPPSRGEIRWRGENITGWSAPRRAQAGIARTMQVTSIFPNLTVADNVWLAAQRALGPLAALAARERFGDVAARVEACLGLAGLSGRAEEPAASIGHGDQRLLEIAIALALGPRLLLLDEPTAGMSVKESWETVRRLREIRRRDRLTIVIVEHDMEIVMELAERISVLHLGRTLAEGTPDEIARDPEVQRVYLGGR